MSEKKTILHADDSPRWRDLVVDSLSDDYQVVSARDCDAVLTRLKQGGVDLVILDHLMPGSDPFDTGFEVCQQIRKQYPQLPVAIFSGAWDDIEDVQVTELETKWGARFVRKRSGAPALQRVVTELLPK